MTVARITTRRTRLERRHAEVVAMIVEGKSGHAIAQHFGAATHSVLNFQKRHEAEILAARAEFGLAVVGAAISRQANRILGYQEDYDRLGGVIEARQEDTRYTEPGYSTGLMAHSLKSVGVGRRATVVDEFKVDTSLIQARNVIRRSVAEELAQLPRPDVHIGDKNVFILEVAPPPDHVGDVPELG